MPDFQRYVSVHPFK